jgi:hypothetical protein
VGEYTTAEGWISKIAATFQDILSRLEAAETKLKSFEDEGVPLLAEEGDEVENKEVIEGDENHEEN